MIWKRYLLKEFLKVFAIVLFGFFFLYCALDYSFHMEDFLKNKNIHLADFILYYSHLFIKRTDLMISLALLIASIKVLCTLNANRELLALQVAGLNFKKLITPFLLVATCCTLFHFVSVEFILPHSTVYLDDFHHSHFKHPDRGHRAIARKEKLHVIPLSDRSKVIYQYFDKEKDAYFDVIWMRSADDLWRIKYLKTGAKNPQGKYVDHFVRHPGGFFEKESSHVDYEFTQLRWTRETSNNPFIPYENRKASELWRMAHRSTTTAYEKAEILTNFYFKSAMPLLPLLVIIAASPFCIRYSRSQPVFFIYAFGIFSYVAFYLFMNASVILGETNVFSPIIAIFAPFILCGAFFSWKFIKTV